MKASDVPDYYSILGVPPSAGTEQITSAYKDLAKRYHPDRHMGNDLQELAEEKLRQLNQAYDTLMDVEKRAVYDADRAAGTTFTSTRTHPPTATTPTPQSFPLAKTIQFVVMLAVAYFAFRFIRNPRAMAVAGVALAIAWFGPRIIRWFKR